MGHVSFSRSGGAKQTYHHSLTGEDPGGRNANALSAPNSTTTVDLRNGTVKALPVAAKNSPLRHSQRPLKISISAMRNPVVIETCQSQKPTNYDRHAFIDHP